MGPSPALLAFCRALDADPVFCATVRAASTPDSIVELAQQHGFALTRLELRLFSRQLVSNCFPWATKSRAERLRFFNEDPTAAP